MLAGMRPLFRAPSPQLALLNGGTQNRLIDEGMIHYEVSASGFTERYSRGQTPHTIHVWWARRPHSSMRPLVFASLCKSRSDEALETMTLLSRLDTNNPAKLQSARRQVAQGYDEPPRLLDMFAGGGTIPFEAAGLGAEVYAIDCNELSVFIQKCLLIYTTAENGINLPELISSSGRRILSDLSSATESLFPHRGKAFGYYWTYSTSCPRCDLRFFLSRRPLLSSKRGKRIRFFAEYQGACPIIRVGTSDQTGETASPWLGQNGRVVCPGCKNVISGVSIRECQDELVAIISADGKGKSFHEPDQSAIIRQSVLSELETKICDELGVSLPSSRLPRWSGIVNPALYGIETHADIFNVRQRITLLLLIKCLRIEYERLRAEVPDEVAKLCIGLLSALIDQLVDWNCRLSMWIPQNEQVGRAFCGPGVAMLWDYIETDPVMRGPANLWAKLDRIVAGVRNLRRSAGQASMIHGDAQNLPFPAEFFDAIVTDPPYYDNIYYNVLADFFFSWKRLLLAPIEPGLFSRENTDGGHELVSSKFRSGDHQKAHEEYSVRLTKVLREAERVLKMDGVLSFVYSHGSLRGWEALARAFQQTNLWITSVQPLSIERKQRPRAMTSDAVNTCVVFVARRGPAKPSREPVKDICDKLNTICNEFGKTLREAGWNERDIGLAVYAHGVAMLANSKGGLRSELDTQTLAHLAEVVRSHFRTFKVVSRRSL